MKSSFYEKSGATRRGWKSYEWISKILWDRDLTTMLEGSCSGVMSSLSAFCGTALIVPSCETAPLTQLAAFLTFKRSRVKLCNFVSSPGKSITAQFQRESLIEGMSWRIMSSPRCGWRGLERLVFQAVSWEQSIVWKCNIPPLSYDNSETINM